MIEPLDDHRQASRDLSDYRHSERQDPGESGMLEHSHIEIGFQVYAVEGGEEFGAVRGYMSHANALVIYLENAGDFVVPLEAVQRVHDGKVIVDVGRLDARLREAIAHAHDREEPGV